MGLLDRLGIRRRAPVSARLDTFQSLVTDLEDLDRRLPFYASGRVRLAKRNPVIRKAVQLVSWTVAGQIVQGLRVTNRRGDTVQSRAAATALHLLTERPSPDLPQPARPWVEQIIEDAMLRGAGFALPLRSARLGRIIRLERLTLPDDFFSGSAIIGAGNLGGISGGNRLQAITADTEMTWILPNGDPIELPFGDVITVAASSADGSFGYMLPDSPLDRGGPLSVVIALTQAANLMAGDLLRVNRNPWLGYFLQAEKTVDLVNQKSVQNFQAELEAVKNAKPGDPRFVQAFRKVTKFLLDATEADIDGVRSYVIRSVGDCWNIPGAFLDHPTATKYGAGYAEMRRSLHERCLAHFAGIFLDAFGLALLPAGQRFRLSGEQTGAFGFHIKDVVAALGSQQTRAFITPRRAAGILDMPPEEVEDAMQAQREHLQETRNDAAPAEPEEDPPADPGEDGGQMEEPPEGPPLE